MLDINAVSSGTVEAPVDYTGGSGFLWEQNVHEVTVTQCYGVKKSSGSMCLHFEFDKAGKKFKEDCYFLSSKGKIDYPVKDKQGNETGKTRHIPGFVTCANIIATAFPDSYKTFVADETKGTSLTARYEAFFQEALQSMTPGTVPIYSYDLKKDVNTDVDHVMVSVIGKSLKLAINKNLVNKRKKNDQNVYVPIAESREENEIANSFAMDDFTAAEMLAGESTPAKQAAWLKANAGKTNDKRTIKDDSPAASTPVGAAPQTSLFG